MPDPKRKPGFTLIELILVMVIIGLLLAIVAPSLGRMRTRSRVDDTATQLRSLIELARTRAVTDGRPTRLVVDTQTNECWIEHLEGGGFIRPAMAYSKKFELDRDVLIESPDAEGTQGDTYDLLAVRAEPDGTAQVAQLTAYSTRNGYERVIYTRSATEAYRIGDPEDAVGYAIGGTYAP